MTSRKTLVLLALCFALAPSPSSAARKKSVPEQLRWNKDWGPMVPHKKFPRDCGICHLPKSWDEMRPDFKYDHKKETGYALEGAHAHASCLRCHNDRGPVASYKARGCAGCHPDAHKNAMGMDCARCHNQETWEFRVAKGDQAAEHAARTRFPLFGVHATLRCEECHKRASAGDFRGAPRDCFQCHRDAFPRGPNHVASNFPHDCRPCHRSGVWAGGIIDHSAFGASVNCTSCHMPDYQRAPGHVAKNYPQTCLNCHTTATWLGASFNHSFLGGSPDCAGCHLDKYQAAPNHAAKSYPQTCASCHNTSSWLGASFNHSFLGGSPVCVNCHLANYQSAPNHVAMNFPQTCADCHTTTTWLGASFNHALLGGSPNCVSCHLADFNAAVSPVNHVAQGISANACSTCHTDFTSWMNFTHTPSSCYNSGTNRSHKNATCTQCHSSGNYLSATCTACHSNRSSCN